MVHKKKHDMVLNLGLGARGNTFSDQTPTPTQFIRNCEEVGLFQDLQDVNPFEETFRKAVEAVKAGQTPALDKPFLSNPSDDTLHTPNVFPHITHLPSSNANVEIGRQDCKNFHDNLLKKDNVKNPDEKELQSKNVLEPNKLISESIIHQKRRPSVCHEYVDKEVKNNQNHIIHEKKEETCFKNVSSNDSVNDLNNEIHMAIKEKLRNSIHSKQMPLLIQLKLPIPKSKSISRCQKSPKDRFSIFSKNSLKFESSMEKSEHSVFDLNKKRNVKKNYSGLPKEKIEILERNRAAATRCREKKKIYISYLEKLNRELTDTNRKLAHHNSYLKKLVSDLQGELSKHHNCSVTNSKEESSIASVGNAGTIFKSPEQFEMDGKISKVVQNGMGLQENAKTNINLESAGGVSNNYEFSLNDKFSCQNENGSHAVNNESFSVFYSKPCSMKSFYEEDRLRKIYIDHSYFNYPYLTKLRKKYPSSAVARPKLTPGFLSMNVRNQSFTKENRTVDVALAQTESVLQIETQDVTL